MNVNERFGYLMVAEDETVCQLLAGCIGKLFNIRGYNVSYTAKHHLQMVRACSSEYECCCFSNEPCIR